MTPHSRSTHLTDDQLADWLLAEYTPAAAAHMAACPACRQRAIAFTRPLADFNQASMNWAEARSNSLPLSTSSRAGFRFLRLLPAPALVMAAALLAGLGAHWTHHQPSSGDQAYQPSSSADVDTSLSGDNALLADINRALAPPERSPLDAYADQSQSAADDAHSGSAGR